MKHLKTTVLAILCLLVAGQLKAQIVQVVDSVEICPGDTHYVSPFIWHTSPGTYNDTLDGIVQQELSFNNATPFYCLECPVNNVVDQATADQDPSQIDLRYYYSSTNQTHSFISPHILSDASYDGTSVEWDNPNTNTTTLYTLNNLTSSTFDSINSTALIAQQIQNGQLATFPVSPDGARLGGTDIFVGAVIGAETQTGKFLLIRIDSLDFNYLSATVKSGPYASVFDTVVTTFLTVRAQNLGITQQGNQLIADNDTAISYQWLNCANGLPIPLGTNRQYSPPQNGSFAVVVSDGVCVDTSACTDFVVSRDLYFNQGVLKPFPNPATDRVTIPVQDTQPVEVFTANGQQVARHQPTPGETEWQWQTGSLPAGVYTYKQGANTGKIILR